MFISLKKGLVVFSLLVKQLKEPGNVIPAPPPPHQGGRKWEGLNNLNFFLLMFSH